MNRSMRTFGVSVVCLVTLAACGSSTKKASEPGPVGTTTTTTTASTAPVTPITQHVCSFATAAQLSTVLGASPAAAGIENDYEPTYKTCNWIATGPAGGNSNAVRLGVVRTSAGQKAFASTKAGLRSLSLRGLGDKATVSTSIGSSGVTEALLVADKGAVSVSIDVTFGGSLAAPASAQDGMEAIVKAIFTKLGA